VTCPRERSLCSGLLGGIDGAPLPPGTKAPDFSLPATPDHKVSLSELVSPVVLIFYPADWSPVCGDELSVFGAASAPFSEQGAQLIGISVDRASSHIAFKADHKLEFPLPADFNPKGAVARAYGVYREAGATSERALFVRDADQVIR
jgi:peroxiredoxin